jgi:hypothetical protein
MLPPIMLPAFTAKRVAEGWAIKPPATPHMSLLPLNALGCDVDPAMKFRMPVVVLVRVVVDTKVTEK